MRHGRTPDPLPACRESRRERARRLAGRAGAGVAITASASLAAALVGTPGAWAAPSLATSASPVAHISAMTGNINGLVDTVVASTVASNGDTNPYDLAVVPFSSGMLVAGDVLVADFNNAAGASGAGMSIVEINPHTGTSTTFYQNSGITGPVGIAINPANDIVWVGFYGGPASAPAGACGARHRADHHRLRDVHRPLLGRAPRQRASAGHRIHLFREVHGRRQCGCGRQRDE